MPSSTFTYITYIRTTPTELWRALTTREVIAKYWFGITVEGNWEPGSTWRFEYDGATLDSGEVLERVPEKRLVRSWRNEWKPAFKAEGCSTCAYQLEHVGGCVKLTVTHSIERPQSTFIETVAESWPMCLSNLKSLLETGDIALREHPGHD
jgi:uncharacterized protein YndB with AHSA1/START domain